jgi:hypothetical protein
MEIKGLLYHYKSTFIIRTSFSAIPRYPIYEIRPFDSQMKAVGGKARNIPIMLTFEGIYGRNE